MNTTCRLMRQRAFAICALLLASATTNLATASEPVLGPGDTVRVTVFDDPTLNTEARVSLQGTVGFPLLGEVAIGNRTALEAARIIADRLKQGRFLNDPRVSVTLLETRLSQKGKRIERISLAECLDEAMRSQRPLADWFSAEREQGVETVVETVHAVLSEYSPLVELVAARMPEDPDPLRDLVFILRTGALFPVYRTFSLLEQLKGRVLVPTVLLYPGHLDGPAGLRFMGVLDAEHNYRPKIF